MPLPLSNSHWCLWSQLVQADTLAQLSLPSSDRSATAAAQGSTTAAQAAVHEVVAATCQGSTTAAAQAAAHELVPAAHELVAATQAAAAAAAHELVAALWRNWLLNCSWLTPLVSLPSPHTRWV